MPPHPQLFFWLLQNWFQSLRVARFNCSGSLDSLISETIDENILSAAAEEPAGEPLLSALSPSAVSDGHGVPLGTVFGTFALMPFDQQQAAAQRAEKCEPEAQNVLRSFTV